ncbi:NADPH-dependent assimilatory sulfite reductase flavoprotein subunit [Gallibacterium salpingitidis]|nr:NADPH-dependent assimilatory sulfite reductase flavoprotein subunit [Gallibacterium salpingitidis]WKS99526.1 NADPH-dependent assimilatory sulfite reductase flavoprotein subunit [Gallibacterium salpingitidis]
MNDVVKLPISTEIAEQLKQLDSLQLAWLSGYCWGQAAQNGAVVLPSGAVTTETAPATAAAARTITIISASQTGNARKVAEQLKNKLSEQHSVTLVSAADYKAKKINQEQILLLVTSTQGDGEPPEEAVNLHRFLFGKKAPSLAGIEFAVLGLGDSSYPNFCQAGKDFDQRFAELGATRLLERADCDLDYQTTANQWIEQINQVLAQQVTATTTIQQAPQNAEKNNVNQYNRENPFSATLSVRQKITGRHSTKDVEHIEIDLGDSGLTYQAGDALGVWFNNDPALVEEILTAVALDGDQQITYQNNSLTLRQALTEHFELTQNTARFVKGYAELNPQAELQALIADPQQLQDYVAATPLVGVLQTYPTKLTAEQLISLLRPLTPRLYSIASAQSEVGEEVHLTVGVVRYQFNGKTYTGGASGFLGERLGEDEEVKVFVESNPNFRLPQDPTRNIIMVGAGTGIAPFRAFMQQRAADEASGENWLIFGNQTFTEDFLYQQEWQDYAKQGLLNRYHFAWSRDQQQKIYVQDKIREQAETLWQWLQQGAYLYVCGDANKMAKDVEQALLDVISQQGNLTVEQAEDYLADLREEKRYQRDVY